MVFMVVDPVKRGLGLATFAAGGVMSVTGSVDMEKITGPTGSQTDKTYLLNKIFSHTGYNNKELKEYITESYNTEGLLAIDGGDKYKAVMAAQAEYAANSKDPLILRC